MIGRTFGVFVACAACLTASLAAAQQRDAPAAPIGGTASIHGQLLSDGNPSRSIRRAIVTLSGDIPGARALITDDEGRFAFSGLPAGRFTVSAKKPAYLPAAYGASKPGRPGTSVSLGAGQTVTISMRMSRGAVLAGLVTDSNGRPAAGISVNAQLVRAAPNAQPAGAAVTDDRGQYRIFGLMPGEYVVTARPTARGAGPIVSPSTAEVDAILGEIARRSTSQSPVGTPSAPVAMPARPIAFAPIYFPGTPIPEEAAPVKVAAGEERSGIDFPLRAVGVATIEGVVSGPIANLGVVQISIVGAAQPSQTMSSMDANPVLEERPSGSDGRFKFTSVTPGHYTIIARADRNQTAVERPSPGTMRASDGGPISSAPNNADYLYAVTEIDTRGDDLGGVTLSLQGGGMFSGSVIFDSTTGAAPKDVTKTTLRLSPASGGSGYIQMGATIIGNTFRFQPPMTVDAEGRATARNIAPGTYALGGSAPEGGWWLRSAIANGRDLLDEPVTFTPGQALAGVAVTFSDKHNELSGTLQAASGAPASEYFVLVFSTDRASWRAGSRRVTTVRPGTDGKFTLRDLPAGTYYIAALEDLEPADAGDPKFLEQIIPAALQVRVNDGERTTQDLRMAR